MAVNVLSPKQVFFGVKANPKQSFLHCQMKNYNNPKHALCFVLEGLLQDTEKRILFGESKSIQFKF